MENKIIFETYKNEILHLFKKYFREAISKNITISFEQILNLTLQHFSLSSKDIRDQKFLNDWFNNIYCQHSLINLIGEESFNEIILHSNQTCQIVHHDQKKSISMQFESNEDYQLCLEILALKNKIEWNYRYPFASFNLTLGNKNIRVTLIHFSTTSGGISKLFIRHLTDEISDLHDLGICKKSLDLLQKAVFLKKNILICGPTGSGKTTLLKTLLNSAHPDEHVITLEDTHELNLKLKFHTSLLSNRAEAKSLKDYCSYALRMSPDRLVIGEMRSDEIVPFILAMNTGHRGLMSSIHANSCIDAISRAALLFCIYNHGQEISFETIIKLICKSLDMVVYIENKKVQSICNIIGSEEDRPIIERLI